MSALEMRPAGADELRTVEGTLSGASEWLASRGIDQWQFPPRRERLLDSMGRGECFLALCEGAPVGTITVDEQADPEFWTADDRPKAALYVHRMAVARRAAGRAIGAGMLDWAADRAATAGKTRLRLDAWKTNLALHRYYLGQGFTLVRTVDLPHRPSGALFERLVSPSAGRDVTSLTDINTPAPQRTPDD